MIFILHLCHPPIGQWRQNTFRSSPKCPICLTCGHYLSWCAHMGTMSIIAQLLCLGTFWHHSTLYAAADETFLDALHPWKHSPKCLKYVLELFLGLSCLRFNGFVHFAIFCILVTCVSESHDRLVAIASPWSAQRCSFIYYIFTSASFRYLGSVLDG